GRKREHGKSGLEFLRSSPLLNAVTRRSKVWMSRFDEVEEVPEGFEVCAKSRVSTAMANKKKNIFTLQFHPEVTHTEEGIKILDNFVHNICKAEKNWKLAGYIERTIAEIREKVGDEKVILGLSGGVDSSVAAVLIHKA